MANEIQITKDFPPSRERAVLLELLAVTQTLKKEGIDAVVCGGWVPFLKELARDSQTSHSMSFDIDVLLRAKARERESVDRIKALLSEPLARDAAAGACDGCRAGAAAPPVPPLATLTSPRCNSAQLHAAPLTFRENAARSNQNTSPRTAPVPFPTVAKGTRLGDGWPRRLSNMLS